jgi:hypothetical protein
MNPKFLRLSYIFTCTLSSFALPITVVASFDLRHYTLSIAYSTLPTGFTNRDPKNVLQPADTASETSSEETQHGC